MRALRVNFGQVGVEEVAVPEACGEALVRVAMSGICNTDVELARGDAGFSGTLGHEFVGVVEDPGGGTCARCAAGDSRHCATRTVSTGGGRLRPSALARKK